MLHSIVRLLTDGKHVKRRSQKDTLGSRNRTQEAVDLIKANDANFFIKAAMIEAKQNFVQVSPALQTNQNTR